MNSDEAYRKGFLDGFREGWQKSSEKESIKIVNQCPICFRDLSKPYAYVCGHRLCPNSIRSTL